MMDSIPNNLIVKPCGNTLTNCEDKLPIKCLSQKLKNLSSFRSIRQIGCPTGAWIFFAIASTTMHVVVDDDGT